MNSSYWDWLEDIPRTFPERVRHITKYHNPLIGETLYDTLEAVHDTTRVIEEVILPWAQHNTYGSGSDELTRGIVCISLCIKGALAFEMKHRFDQFRPVITNIKP